MTPTPEALADWILAVNGVAILSGAMFGFDRAKVRGEIISVIAAALTEQARETTQADGSVKQETHNLAVRKAEEYLRENVRLSAALRTLVDEVKRWRALMDLETPVLHAAREALVRWDVARVTARRGTTE